MVVEVDFAVNNDEILHFLRNSTVLSNVVQGKALSTFDRTLCLAVESSRVLSRLVLYDRFEETIGGRYNDSEDGEVRFVL